MISGAVQCLNPAIKNSLRTSLRRMFGGIKGNENWRKRCNKEVMHLFGDLDILCQNNSVELDWSY